VTPAEQLERVVEMLEEDAARLRRAVPWNLVLRVCEKNHLDPMQLAEVRRRLVQRQVDIEWEQDANTEDEDKDEDEEHDPHHNVTGDTTNADQSPESSRGTDALADSFSTYILEAGHCELLSPQAEKELMRRIRAGERAAEALGGSAEDPEATLHKLVIDGERARGEFIQANLRLVLFVAKRAHRPPGVELEDLVQDGNLGLMRAVEKFDHGRGLRFSTYAIHWIRAFMQRAVVDRGRLVRIPAHIADRIQRLRVATRSLRRELSGQDPAIHDLAARLGWHPETVQFIEDIAAATPVSLDRVIGDDSGTTLGDKLGAPAEQRPDSQFADRETAAETKRALESLPRRLRVIVEQRFGLGGQEERTLQEIGQQYGLSRERIRQLEGDALDALRRLFTRMHKNESKKINRKRER
jgi:RNA polymerase primary sigma factor